MTQRASLILGSALCALALMQSTPTLALAQYAEMGTPESAQAKSEPQADQRDARTFGGHSFLLPLTRSPFLTTHVTSSTGVGFASASFKGIKRDLQLAALAQGFNAQVAPLSWLALNMSVEGGARSPVDMYTLKKLPVEVVSTYSLGGLFRLFSTGRINLSDELAYEVGNDISIKSNDILKSVDGIKKSIKAVFKNPNTQDPESTLNNVEQIFNTIKKPIVMSDTKSLSNSLNLAVGISEWLGVLGSYRYSAPAEGDSSSLINAGLSLDFNPLSNYTPFGILLSYEKPSDSIETSSSETAGYDDDGNYIEYRETGTLTTVSDNIKVDLYYTGRKNLLLGINFLYSTQRISYKYEVTGDIEGSAQLKDLASISSYVGSLSMRYIW